MDGPEDVRYERRFQNQKHDVVLKRKTKIYKRGMKNKVLFFCLFIFFMCAGRGWMLYGPGDWYEGEWYEDKRHGMGLRQYKSGARYKGMWKDGLQNGQGSMKYENNDVCMY